MVYHQAPTVDQMQSDIEGNTKIVNAPDRRQFKPFRK